MSYEISKYWLQDDFSTEDKSNAKDPIKLSAYRNAIANFVRIVTGENIPVKFKKSGNSFTDGKSVTISSRLNDKDFDHTVGLALHEGSHIKLTNFDVLKRLEEWIQKQDKELLAYCKKHNDMGRWDAGYEIYNKLKDLLNIVEDRRIDNFVYRSAPGYKGYYKALYDKYFNAKIIDKGLKSNSFRTEDWESYMFRLCNITNTNRDLSALKGLKEIWNLLDLKNVNRLKSTNDALNVAWKIFNVIESNMEATKLTKGDEENENGDNDAVKKVNDQSNTNIKEDDGKEEKDDGSKAEGEDIKIVANEELSTNQKIQLSKAFSKQKEFLKGDIKKSGVSKKMKELLDVMNTAGISQSEIEVENDHWWSGHKVTIPVNIIRNFSRQTIENLDCGMWYSGDPHSSDTLNVNAGLRFGAMLGKKLKIRSEERTTKFNRRRSGKIDSRMIANAGFGMESIFEKLETFAYDPGIVHISIDNSGSMSGDKFKKSVKTAVAIAKACTMVNNMECVISFRSSCWIEGMGNTRSYDDFATMLIAYDSREHGLPQLKLMAHIQVCGQTPEGLAFDAIMKDILDSANGKDAYFINFSDGMPYFDKYSGSMAHQHTKKQVKKMKNAGIKVLSYYISRYGYNDDKINNIFKTMYGKDAVTIDTDNIAAVAKSMNAKFLEVS